MLASEQARPSAAMSRVPRIDRHIVLQVRRQDIEFTDVSPGRVEIAITVTNSGSVQLACPSGHRPGGAAGSVCRLAAALLTPCAAAGARRVHRPADTGKAR